MLKILLLLASASYAEAACSQLSTHVWHCPDTGNVYTNGSDLKTFLLAHPWACGDSIILYAGVEYRRPDVDLGPDWTLPYQSDCGTSGYKTQFISSRLSEIPFGQRKSLENYRAMMPLMSTSNSSIWAMSGTTAGSNQYAFRGIRHSSTANVIATRGRVSNLFLTAQFEFVCPGVSNGTAACQAYHAVIAQFRPKDFEIDRCIFEEYETTAYPEPNVFSTDGNSFVHSVSLGVYAPFDGLYLHDSYLNFVGYTNTTAESYTTGWISLGSSATNANPAVISNTGLVSALSISYSALCTTATDNFATQGAWDNACLPTGSFDNSAYAARVVIRGATGNWVGLNGPKILRARSDGSVDVLELNPDRGTYINMTYFDSTALGPLTGTVEAARFVLLTQYAVTMAFATKNVRIIDNFMQAWAMPLFTGGVDGPQYDQAVLLTGSTATSLILSHTRELYVGMLVTFNVPVGSGPSSYCHLSSGGCAATDYFRTGKVTAIDRGLGIVTIEGWGPDGTDGTTPDIGQVAWWRNDVVENIQVRGNAISRGYRHPNGDAGKGATEMKHCDYCLWDGNVMGGYLDENETARANINGTYFTEAKSQGGTDPNTTVKRTRISNNLGFGQLADGSPSCMWANAAILTDNEHSIQPGSEVWFEHNMHVGCKAFAGTAFAHPTLNAGTNIGYIHNTFAVDMAQVPTVRTIDHRDCNTYPESYYAAYSRTINSAVQNNIVAYGNGAYLGAPSTAVCWPTILADVQTNIMIDIDSVLAGQAALDAIFPVNYYVANYTSFWEGTCAYDSWANCKLATGNPNRGAASDGGDPGADVDQVRDRLHRWSEQAGLIQVNIPAYTMALRLGSWTLGSVATTVNFTLFDSSPSSGCTVELFTNRNRSTRAADAPTPQACNRASSAVSNNLVGYVFGGSSALTANTEYFYKITDGDRVMVGNFTTTAARPSDAVLRYTYSTARTGALCTNPGMSSGCTNYSSAVAHSVTVPTGVVRYYQPNSGLIQPLTW